MLSEKSIRAAARQLNSQGLRPVNLEPVIESRSGKALFSSRKIKSSDTIVLIHQLCVLLKSGAPIDEAVDSLAQSTVHPLLKEQCSKLSSGLKQGVTFSESFRLSGIEVPTYFHPLIAAAEQTGKLSSALSDGTAQWKYELRTRQELISSLTYPFILIISGVASVGIIFTLVVPKFSKILSGGSAVDLPWLAKVVLGLGQFFHENMIWVLSMTIALLVLTFFLLSNKVTRAKVWNLFIYVPMVGAWIIEADIGRWAAMLGTLLQNRVDLIQALKLSQTTVSLVSLQSSFYFVTSRVNEGASLAEAMQDRKAVTPTAINLIRVGERSGELPQMLHALSELYDDSVKVRTKKFLALVEPLAILIIGAVVGLIMAGVILAITSINQISI